MAQIQQTRLIVECEGDSHRTFLEGIPSYAEFNRAVEELWPNAHWLGKWSYTSKHGMHSYMVSTNNGKMFFKEEGPKGPCQGELQSINEPSEGDCYEATLSLPNGEICGKIAIRCTRVHGVCGQANATFLRCKDSAIASHFKQPGPEHWTGPYIAARQPQALTYTDVHGLDRVLWPCAFPELLESGERSTSGNTLFLTCKLSPAPQAPVNPQDHPEVTDLTGTPEEATPSNCGSHGRNSQGKTSI